MLAIVAAAAVTALAADGDRVAYAAGCEVRTWRPGHARTSLVARMACPQTSTGSGISAVAIAGARVLWLHYAGGNTREWSLWTADVRQPRPRRLRFVAQDVDAPPPIVLGEGDGSRYGALLPYAVGDTVYALAPSGARRFTWRGTARIVSVDVHGGELAIAQEDGRVVVLERRGRVLVDHDGGGRADGVELSGSALVVQRGRALEHRTGTATYARPLPRGASLQDAAGDRAFYVAGARAYELALSSGRTRSLGTGSAVAAEGPRLLVASGRRIRLLRIG